MQNILSIDTSTHNTNVHFQQAQHSLMLHPSSAAYNYDVVQLNPKRIDRVAD